MVLFVTLEPGVVVNVMHVTAVRRDPPEFDDGPEATKVSVVGRGVPLHVRVPFDEVMAKLGETCAKAQVGGWFR